MASSEDMVRALVRMGEIGGWSEVKVIVRRRGRRRGSGGLLKSPALV